VEEKSAPEPVQPPPLPVVGSAQFKQEVVQNLVWLRDQLLAGTGASVSESDSAGNPQAPKSE
jgi:hypothetical protein